jgi:hypothetical protein
MMAASTANVKTWFTEFGDTFSLIGDDCVHCNVCEANLRCKQKYDLTHHIGTKKHKDAVNQPIKGDFYKDLCLAFAASNIPLNKLQNPV